MKSHTNMRSQSLLYGSVCVTLMLILGASSMGLAADWPNYRGPNYDGISKETGWNAAWQGEPTVAWKKALGWGFASMAVSDGRVYATGNKDDNDILYCYDAATGKEIWKHSYPCPLYDKQHEGGPCATPTVEGNAVYVFSKAGDALRLNAKTGEVVWHKNPAKASGIKPPRWYFSGSPLIVEDMVILNVGISGMALNKADGSIAWKSKKGGAGYATAVPYSAGGKKCVLMFGGREIFGVVASTGKILWRHPWKTKYEVNAADPILVGDTVFVSSGYNEGCGLLKIGADGVTEIYKNKDMRNHFNCSVLLDGYLYGFDEKKLTCMDLKTGQVAWIQDGLGKGSLMAADDKLIILSEKGKLVTAKVSSDKFEEMASGQILSGKCWTVPVLANGRIYARNAAGDLVCVDVRAGK